MTQTSPFPCTSGKFLFPKEKCVILEPFPLDFHLNDGDSWFGWTSAPCSSSGRETPWCPSHGLGLQSARSPFHPGPGGCIQSLEDSHSNFCISTFVQCEVMCMSSHHQNIFSFHDSNTQHSFLGGELQWHFILVGTRLSNFLLLQVTMVALRQRTVTCCSSQ